jgi:quercetin dioxygenase-like cupin family protein
MPSISDPGAPSPAATDLPPAALYRTMADHQWRPLDPRNPSGTQIAILWENSVHGSYGALLRFPAGFRSPMHSHSADEYTVTLQGTAIHWTEAESEATAKRMTPGSFTLIRGGVSHVSSCAEGEECIAFLTQSAPFDFTLSPLGIQREPAQREQRP